jgi:hypothetical protein
LEFGKDNLALHTELFCKLIDADLGHNAPVSVRKACVTVFTTSWTYSYRRCS